MEWLGLRPACYQSLLLISRNRVRVVKTYIFAIYTISREGQHQLTFSAFKVKWKWLEGKSTAEGVKILHNWNNLSSWVTLTLSVRSECHYCRPILVGHEDIVMDITLQKLFLWPEVAIRMYQSEGWVRQQNYIDSSEALWNTVSWALDTE